MVKSASHTQFGPAFLRLSRILLAVLSENVPMFSHLFPIVFPIFSSIFPSHSPSQIKRLATHSEAEGRFGASTCQVSSRRLGAIFHGKSWEISPGFAPQKPSWREIYTYGEVFFPELWFSLLDVPDIS